MKLSPRELDHLILHNAGSLAQKRLARGAKLNAAEAIALIATVVMERARDGDATVAQLMSDSRTMLGVNQVLPGIPSMVTNVQVECTFRDGTKLVTVHDPISQTNGDLELALYGSFLPAPNVTIFPPTPPAPFGSLLATPPGHLFNPTTHPQVPLNKNSSPILLSVTNTTDRPIQVGSHYHFLECNPYLSFDRSQSHGRRLNIAAGTAVRFEPGEVKTVSLVKIGGNQVVRGGNNLTDGPANTELAPKEIMDKVKLAGFLHVPADTVKGSHVSMTRASYTATYGPTTGDRVRLGDTALVIEIEKDAAEAYYGDEIKFGGGKVLRDGLGQATGFDPKATLDTVITNALIVDYTGIYKADVGIKDGLIHGIGKAGNPDTQDGVHPNLVVGVNTEAIAGEGLILTAGGIDSHIHYICPQLADEAIASGLTTMLGGGTGPASGTCATTCTPSPNAMKVSKLFSAPSPLPLIHTVYVADDDSSYGLAAAQLWVHGEGKQQQAGGHDGDYASGRVRVEAA